MREYLSPKVQVDAELQAKLAYGNAIKAGADIGEATKQAEAAYQKAYPQAHGMDGLGIARSATSTDSSCNVNDMWVYTGTGASGTRTCYVGAGNLSYSAWNVGSYYGGNESGHWYSFFCQTWQTCPTNSSFSTWQSDSNCPNNNTTAYSSITIYMDN